MPSSVRLVKFQKTTNRFGTPNPDLEGLKETNLIERFNLILLGALIIFLGILPQSILTMFHATVDHLLQLSLVSKLV